MYFSSSQKDNLSYGERNYTLARIVCYMVDNTQVNFVFLNGIDKPKSQVPSQSPSQYQITNS